eukprot:g3391.t1
MGLIDIAANLTDEAYQGIYNDKQYHSPDLDQVLQRAKTAGVENIIVTGGNLEMSRQALEVAESNAALFSTVGVHPTRCNEFSGRVKEHLNDLLEVANQGMQKGKVVAIGECGLDYDRLSFCDKEVQKQHFADQFWLTEQTKLPMFLHMRAAADDFMEILSKNISKFHGGVVHSFTGSLDDVRRLSTFDNLFIGINGCSLKTEENLEVVAQIPLDLMMIETDCPYCEIRNSHAGRKHIDPEHILKAVDKKKFDGSFLVKGRNEPCNVRHVLDIVAAVKRMDRHILEQQLYNNTLKLFPTMV